MSADDDLYIVPILEYAKIISEELDKYFPVDERNNRQVLALAEEVGEFVGAYRRFNKMARRPGNWKDVETELADVIITAYVTAHVLGINIDRIIENKANEICSRGWKDWGG